jgi:hypothetical protein
MAGTGTESEETNGKIKTVNEDKDNKTVQVRYGTAGHSEAA